MVGVFPRGVAWGFRGPCWSAAGPEARYRSVSVLWRRSVATRMSVALWDETVPCVEHRCRCLERSWSGMASYAARCARACSGRMSVSASSGCAATARATECRSTNRAPAFRRSAVPPRERRVHVRAAVSRGSGQQTGDSRLRGHHRSPERTACPSPAVRRASETSRFPEIPSQRFPKIAESVARSRKGWEPRRRRHCGRTVRGPALRDIRVHPVLLPDPGASPWAAVRSTRPFRRSGAAEIPVERVPGSRTRRW